jgi:regulator of cell morphogenesis and NO signaling
MRDASGGYKAPADACVSFQTLYKALADFEADLHQHIHLENNILFPRAIALEKAH